MDIWCQAHLPDRSVLWIEDTKIDLRGDVRESEQPLSIREALATLC